MKHIAALTEGLTLTGELRRDVPAFLHRHGCPKTAAHSELVAAEARRVALRFGADPDLAEQAGWLHDVSAVFPTPERARVARDLGLEVLPEEEAFPMIVHQKLSVVLAREIFGVTSPEVLSAVGCHTTLKGGAELLDLVLFVADKIEWDQSGVPPYRDGLLAAMDESLEAAAFHYISYLIDGPGTLKVLHPWLKAAYDELHITIR